MSTKWFQFSKQKKNPPHTPSEIKKKPQNQTQKQLNQKETKISDKRFKGKNIPL